MARGLVNNRKGMTLIEVVVAGGIGTVVLLGMASMMTVQNKSIMGNRTLASRDQLASSIARYAGHPESLDKSILYPGGDFPTNTSLNSGGDLLKKCVNGIAPAGCVAKSGGAPISYEMTLTDPDGKVVAGPPGKEAVYDVNGTYCGAVPAFTPSPRCPILVWTTFTATCASGTDTCDQANSITVTYHLKQAGVVLEGYGKIKETSGSVMTAVPLPVGGSTQPTPNALAKWFSNSVLGSSSIFEVAGNVGVGVSAPQTKFHVVGGIQISEDGGADPCSDASNGGKIRYRNNQSAPEACVFDSGSWGWKSLVTGNNGNGNPIPNPNPNPPNPNDPIITVQSNGPNPVGGGYGNFFVVCPGTSKMTGGGVNCADAGSGQVPGIMKTAPFGNGWMGSCSSNDAYNMTVYAICAQFAQPAI